MEIEEHKIKEFMAQLCVCVCVCVEGQEKSEKTKDGSQAKLSPISDESVTLLLRRLTS